MLEILVWSVFLGTLGIEAVMASALVRWQQVVVKQEYQEEEEMLTSYDSKDNITDSHQSQRANKGEPPQDPRLSGWEYKIVRASSDLFRDPTVLAKLCEEESLAGWILFEKLDDRRVRFKRPLAMREVITPDALAFDPYRSHYGPSSNWLAWIAGIAAVTAMVLPAYLGFMLVSSTIANSRSPASTPLAPVVPPASLSEPENSSPR